MKEVGAELGKRNPGLKHAGKAVIRDGVVREYELITDAVKDISPVRGFAGVEKLTLAGSRTAKCNGILTDLSPLAGMRVKWLSVSWNPDLKDLSPLREVPLELLNCGECNVSDLSRLNHGTLKVLVCGFNPIKNLEDLRGMKLEELWCNTTPVRDLGPLAGMPLRELRCQDSPIESLEPLRGAPLDMLECHRTNISEIEALTGNATLGALNLYSTRVADLTPLKTLPRLRMLALSYNPARDQLLLGSLAVLEEINGQPAKTFLKNNQVGPALLR